MNSIFIAVSIPPGISQTLQRLTHGISNTEWVEKENLHITLRYIGKIQGFQLHDIAEALQDIQAKPISLKIKGMGHFIKKRGITLYAQIDNSSSLTPLKNMVDKKLGEVGFPKSRSHYIPHITIGYYKGKNNETVAHFLEANSFFETETFEIKSFKIFSSHKSLKRRIYTEEASFPLQNP